ncbi:MAG: BamA/TamA family outer membrane protein [Parachlamydiales bacterium]|nr:BamA/TamA family outer membrane protein [Parachlamydiales bacterium]
MYKINKSLIFFIFLFPIFLFSIDYEVQFKGLKDKDALSLINDASNLITLKNRPPKTINALKFRANGDIDEIVKILHAFGYYDANVQIDLEEKNKKVIVYVFISTGPKYLIKSVKIFNALEDQKELSICNITVDKIGLTNDKVARADTIINGERRLLYFLSTCGYPLAKLDKKQVLIDLTEKKVSIEFYIDPGVFTRFGYTTISGLKDIDPVFIEKQIKYKEGEKYDQKKVFETQKRLLSTNLFSSVSIVHKDQEDKLDELPMDIKVVEALHKYFTTGISYATIDGFGGSLGWANRNYRSVGELLAFDLNVAQRELLGVATYKKPDFIVLDQDYLLRLEAHREKIPLVYLALNYFMTNRLDRKFSKRLDGSLGIKAEYLSVMHSGNNGKFFLFSIPGYIRYTTTNSLLNPTEGYSITYRISPFANIIRNTNTFLKQIAIFEFYLPIEKSRTLVLAVRSQVGSIIGPNIFELPLTKLFLGGSDDDLRGYRYRTVSPLNDENQPIGGRSAIYFSIEPRFRVSRSLGLVPFLDIGTVSVKKYPDIHEKWYKGVGLGFRYFSFFGPLRFDLGIPLNRRKGIDKRYRIYASVGQTF